MTSTSTHMLSNIESLLFEYEKQLVIDYLLSIPPRGGEKKKKKIGRPRSGFKLVSAGPRVLAHFEAK